MLDSERDQNAKNQDLVSVLLLMVPSLGVQTSFPKLLCRLSESNSAFSHAVTRVRSGARQIAPVSVHF